MSILRTFVLSMCLLLIATDTHCGPTMQGDKKHNVIIRHVSIYQLGDGSFKTIGEYFGNQEEHSYFRCIARDNENIRAGTYFVVRFNKSITLLPREIFVRIYVITSLRDGVLSFKCRIPDHRYAFVSEMYCGITSMPIDVKNLKAWKVELIDKNDQVLCSRQSYMWQ
ncbi:MAG: hypothetical protein LBS22_00145 [Puniceicoccales bacterium]|nr:hypothetical protein [Puniceicoccales bacterium]